MRAAQQLALELGKVDASVEIFVDRHDLGDRLTPGQFVAVVLVGPNEYDRTFVGRDLR